MSPITVGVQTPPRTRSFSEADAREAHDALTKLAAEGSTLGVGYGQYNTAEAARSAGATLNKFMGELGLLADGAKWATTVFADPNEDGKFLGVLLPKAAKKAPANSGRKAAKKRS